MTHKYGAKPTTVDGIRFASKKEARRWSELVLLMKAGEVRNLRRQVWFVLLAPEIHGALEDINRGTVKGTRPIGRYVADFMYERVTRGGRPFAWEPVVEDAKGFKTDMYVWKKRHFETQYGVKILET